MAGSRMSPLKQVVAGKMTQSVMGPDMLRSQNSTAKKTNKLLKQQRNQEKRKQSKDRAFDKYNASDDDASVDVNDEL